MRHPTLSSAICLLLYASQPAAAQERDARTGTQVDAQSGLEAPLPDARRRARVHGGATLGVALVGGLMVGAVTAADCDSLDCLGGQIGAAVGVGLASLPLVPLLAERLGHSGDGRGHFGGAILGTIVGAAVGGLSFGALGMAHDLDRGLRALGAFACLTTIAGTAIGYELSHARATVRPTLGFSHRGGRLGVVASF